MIETIGGWTIVDIDMDYYNLSVNLSTHIDIDIEEEYKNIDDKENIKIPLLSPNTGKPFANLVIFLEDDEIYADLEIIDEREKSLYDSIDIKFIDRYDNKLSITLLATIRMSKRFTIEEKNNSYIIKLKFPVCILPLYFENIMDIFESIEESKNLESFRLSIPTSDLDWSVDWRDIPDDVFDEISERGQEFLENIEDEIVLEDIYIKLNKKNKVIKSDLVLNTGQATDVKFEGIINIYYDTEEKSMIAELLVDTLKLFIDMDDENIHIKTKEYNFMTLDFLSKKELMDFMIQNSNNNKFQFNRLISATELKIPIKDYNTAVQYGFYIIDWFNMVGKEVLQISDEP